MKKINHGLWIWNIWKEKIPFVIFLSFLTIISTIVAISFPLVTKVLMDTLDNVLKNPSQFPNPLQETDKLVGLLLLLGLGVVLQALFPTMRAITNLVFEFTIRQKYFKAIINKDPAFFRAFKSGDICTRLTDDISDAPRLAWFLCSGIFRAVESIVKVSGCTVMMILLSPKLALITLIPIPFMAVVHYITEDKIYDANKKNQEAISNINSQLEMSFSGARIIKAFACEDKYNRFFKETLDKRTKTEYSATRLDIILRIIYQYIDYIAQTIVIVAGGAMVITGEISIGIFLAFYQYLGMIVFPVLDIPQLLVGAKKGFVTIDRLEEMKNFPKDVDLTKGIESGKIESIEFKNVCFTYENRHEMALDNVNFKIMKGTTTCIIGPISAGKTTIIKLILGLLKPSSGEILINGKSIDTINLVALRTRFGWVPQDPLLFKGTIKENVAFGTSHPDLVIDDLHYNDVVETAQLSNEINSLPDGHNTLLGQRGAGVSGGQRQRIACARGFARLSDVLLLDDVTASLDAANEAKLLERLRETQKDMTCIMISHRLSSLNFADYIIHMENGKIISEGTSEELKTNKDFIDFTQHAQA